MSVWLPILLGLVGVGCASAAMIAQMRGLRPTPYYAGAASAYALTSILHTLTGDSANACLYAAGAAAFGWLWWHNGGGDGTRRRLKSWAACFQGVRRTAPSHT